MLLTRLKYWREQRGYSLRELAAKIQKGIKDGQSVKMSPATISLLENSKRPPHASTVKALATALGVEPGDLYEPAQTPASQEPVGLEQKYTPAINGQKVKNNKTSTTIKPARPTRVKKQPTGNFWISDDEGDVWGPFSQVDAERLKVKLGGQHQARVYEAASKAEARELHRAFLTRVARGHDAW